VPANVVDDANAAMPTTPPVADSADAELPPPTPDAVPTPGKRKTRTRADDAPGGSKRAKTGAAAKEYAPPSARLADVGGAGAAVEKLLELVAMPLTHAEIYVHTGVAPPRGVLLHGPPGCGKTLLAHAIAGVRLPLLPLLRTGLTMTQELGVPFINVSAPSIVSGMSGESEKTLRDTFDEAKVPPNHNPLNLSLTPMAEARSVSPVHRRDRRDHAETRERSA
jgi:ribosome biogenesis ATPase